MLNKTQLICHLTYGTMQIVDLRHIELFLSEGYQNGSWKYEQIGHYDINKHADGASGGIFDTKHIKDSTTSGYRKFAKENSFQRFSISELSVLSSEDLSNSLVGSNLHALTLAELKVITHGYSSSNFIGEGGFGPVYKGFVDDKLKPGLKAQPVAIKLLDLDGTQGHKEWLTEVIFHGQLRHPHLVKLIGYCCEDEHRVLIYKYMPRGSLENQLFRKYSVTSMVNKNKDCSWSCKTPT